MKVLSAVLCACLGFTAAFAQAPKESGTKVPARQEALLKQQVNKFWQCFVDGKFRAADAMVAQDAKEEFFVWPKKQIRGFRYDQAFFSASGKEAKVVVVVDTDLAMMGIGSMKIEKPVHTWWRMEKGNWYWFQPKNEMRETPFGKEPTNVAAGSTPLMAMGQAGAPTLESLRNMVRMDKTDVKFVSGTAGETSLEIRNTMPGVVLLTFDAPRQADELDIKLESNQLPRESVGHVVIKYDPAKDLRADKSTKLEREFKLGVAQTGRTFTIRVTIEPKP